MPLEEQILSPDSSPFTIRRFVSTVRGKDFSKCWPFPQRILERCLILGMKVELPPLEAPPNGHMCGSCSINTQLPLNECSERIVSCSFCHGSSKEDVTNSDSKESVEALSDPAMEKVFLCNAEVLNMVEVKVGVDIREHLLSTQEPDKAVEVKPLTENFWNDNTVDCKTDIVSNSASQMVVDPLPDNDASSNLAGLDITSTPGPLHLKSDCVAVMEEPDCLVVQEDSCGVPKNHSGKPAVPCDTNSEPLNEEVADSLQHSTSAITDLSVHHGDSESLTAVFKPVVRLNESEPIGYSRRTERSKNTEDLALLRSNSDAGMPQVCPVCLKFSSTSNTALNAHIDHCLILDEADDARLSKKRVKLKKMRSMVDIYASAPARTLEDLEISSEIWFSRKVKQ